MEGKKLNWFLTLRNLSKTDPVAAELFNNLQKAETDEEKDTAKQNAQEYIQKIQSKETESNPSEETVVDTTNSVAGEVDGQGDNVVSATPDSADTEGSGPENTEEFPEKITEESEEKVKTDLSQPAFNPRLAKCGITREEELFLNHVYVRKLSHEEKILMRRSIYQKKTQRNAQIQAELKAKRMAQKQKDLSDPEKIKFHQERKFVDAICKALEQHCNMGWIFSRIDGLTPEIVKDLLKKPANVNAFNTENRQFVDNFRKKYGD